MAGPSKLRVSIEVIGDDVAASVINDIGYRARETMPLMAEFVGVMQSMQARRMHDKPWQPLTEGTVERKVREGENPDIFRDEQRYIKGKGATRQRDHLFKAITVPNHPSQLRHFTRTTATFGVKSSGHGPLFYARFVQNVKGKKRKIMALTAAQAQILVAKTAYYIVSGLGAPKRKRR